MTYINNALIFLIEVIFNLALLVILARLILQWRRADFYNPLSQIVIKITNPMVMPLRQFIPPIQRIDSASLLLFVVLEIIKLFLEILIKTGGLPNILGLLIWSLGDLLDLVIVFYFYAILIFVLFSWINPYGTNPMIQAIYLIAEPLLNLGRRFVPPIASLDLSPVVVMICLKLIEILLVDPIVQLGVNLTLRT